MARLTLRPRRALEALLSRGRLQRGGSAHLRLAGLALLALLALACRDTTDLTATGETLYRRHCASCHGLGGKGDGPVAPTLQRAPTDLTTIARRAEGHFDESRVMAIIDGRYEVAAHGPREMPVWGAVFEGELEGEPYGAYRGVVWTRALSDYLRAMQQP